MYGWGILGNGWVRLSAFLGLGTLSFSLDGRHCSEQYIDQHDLFTMMDVG